MAKDQNLYACPWCEVYSLSASDNQTWTSPLGKELDLVFVECAACQSWALCKLTRAAIDTMGERRERSQARRRDAADAMARMAGA